MSRAVGGPTTVGTEQDATPEPSVVAGHDTAPSVSVTAWFASGVPRSVSSVPVKSVIPSPGRAVAVSEVGARLTAKSKGCERAIVWTSAATSTAPVLAPGSTVTVTGHEAEPPLPVVLVQCPAPSVKVTVRPASGLPFGSVIVAESSAGWPKTAAVSPV